MSCIPVTSFGLPEWGNSTSSFIKGNIKFMQGAEDDFGPPRVALRRTSLVQTQRKMTMKMNVFTATLLSLLLVPMSLATNGAETNSVRSLMGIRLGEHEDFMHSPHVVNSIINGRGNFRKGKDGDLDCRITENQLRTPFKFFDRVCVYSTPDTRVIYKIELPCQTPLTRDELFRIENKLKCKTGEIIYALPDVTKVLSKKYGKSHTDENEDGTKLSYIFKFLDSEMRLDGDAPILRDSFKEHYCVSVKLSLVDPKLVQHVKEATKKAIETKVQRQKFIDDGGLL